MLGLKFVKLLVISALLSMIHFRIQPRIDALSAKAGGGKFETSDADQVRRLRITRKRISSVCMFSVR